MTSRSETATSSGPLSKAYGLGMYALSQGAIVVWALFLCNVGLFKIDASTGSQSVSSAWAVNLGLILLFGIQHTVMARGRFKERIVKLVPPHLERSTFVGISGVVVFAMAAFWQPLPGVVYQLDGASRLAMWGLYGLGWVIVVIATMLIDDKALNGLTQSFSGNPTDTGGELLTPSLYKLVRHPMMLGFMIVFWASPDMTQGRLLTAVAMTLYVIVGMHFEERALLQSFGSEYEAYQKRVPMILPWPR